MAACLAAGGVALVSHGIAAGLHELLGEDGGTHLTVVTRRILVPDVKIHVVTGLQRPDCAVKNGIPITTVARTIIDLAQTLRPARLEEVLDHALAARAVSLGVLERRPDQTGTQGRRGAGVLDAPIAARLVGSPRPRQRGERLFAEIIAEYGLPPAEREVEYHLSDGRTVDVDWVFCRVVGVEIDSHRHHSTLTDWSADHTRNNLLRAQGLILLNVTYPQLWRERKGVADLVTEALVSRGPCDRPENFSGLFLRCSKTGPFLSVPLRIVVLASRPPDHRGAQSDEGADMGTQRAEGPGTEPGFETAEANGVRLSTVIDPRLAEVWTTLFAAELDAEDLAEQVGWFLRMAYLRGYHDGLCEPEAGLLYRELGARVPPRRRSMTTRPGTTH